jgi:hypothetical protein
MTTIKQITTLIIASGVALAIAAAPMTQAAVPKRHHTVPVKHQAILRIKHVGTKTVLVPTRKPGRSTKVFAAPSAKDTPGLIPTVPAATPGGSPDPRLLGTPNGVDGTGVPGPGTNH